MFYPVTLVEMWYLTNIFILFLQSQLPDGLNMDKLYAILKEYGEFPEKYRYFKIKFYCQIFVTAISTTWMFLILCVL